MQTYSAEILGKQPEIDNVLEKGEQLLKKAHPDAVPILKNMIQELRDRWKELKEMVSDCSGELLLLYTIGNDVVDNYNFTPCSAS